MTESVDIRAAAEASEVPATVGASGRRLFGHPPGSGGSLHRGVGAVLLLRHADPAGPLHGRPTASAGAYRERGGLRWLSRALEAVYGPLSIQALASAVFSIYGAGLSDAGSGRAGRRPLAGPDADHPAGRDADDHGGHFLMAFDVSFLAALLCLAIGTGCFKGNIAVEVGALYAPEDNARADACRSPTRASAPG